MRYRPGAQTLRQNFAGGLIGARFNGLCPAEQINLNGLRRPMSLRAYSPRRSVAEAPQNRHTMFAGIGSFGSQD
jgi:hypothetical protein